MIRMSLPLGTVESNVWVATPSTTLPDGREEGSPTPNRRGRALLAATGRSGARLSALAPGGGCTVYWIHVGGLNRGKREKESPLPGAERTRAEKDNGMASWVSEIIGFGWRRIDAGQ